jgi:hypothetical protein
MLFEDNRIYDPEKDKVLEGFGKTFQNVPLNIV